MNQSINQSYHQVSSIKQVDIYATMFTICREIDNNRWQKTKPKIRVNKLKLVRSHQLHWYAHIVNTWRYY